MSTAALPAAVTPDSGWSPTTWNGESALVSSAQGWKAVVSLVRSRLIYFGPAGAQQNLLYAPPTLANRNLLGGHRLWLGPQSTWPVIWPPPDAWEYREPAAVSTAGGELRLQMPESGHDWPNLTRTYRWEGVRLVCGAEFSGGNRPAQFIQILQTPASTVVSVEAQPEENFPAGYVELPGGGKSFAARFEQPPQVSRHDRALVLRHTPQIVKLGFRPQPLRAVYGAYSLQVSRGAQTGAAAGEPDEGFFTQVYLGGPEAIVELEQLTPLFAAGQPAEFEIVLEAARR